MKPESSSTSLKNESRGLLKMKTIPVQLVDTISGAMDEIQNRIRIRAYEGFLSRAGAPGRELDDWLNAERALITLLTPMIVEERGEFVAEMDITALDPQHSLIQATDQEVLIDGSISPSSNDESLSAIP